MPSSSRPPPRTTSIDHLSLLFVVVTLVLLINNTQAQLFGAEEEEIEEEIDLGPDWNAPWRFNYKNSTNLKSDWEVSCTGFRPVCRPQDLLDGKDTGEMNRKTAANSTLGEIGYFCNENRLEKSTIFLSAGASWESTYIVWIAAILLQELVQIPVKIRENVGANHQFYRRRAPQTQQILSSFDDTLNKIDQSRFLGLEVANDHMECHLDALKNASTMSEFAEVSDCQKNAHDVVPSQCKPCQHAILDVWGGAKKELERLVRVTEPGGPLGLISSQGWYISSDVARMHPELASYRGLMNSNVTQKIFKRPLTFGEFCYAMFRRTSATGSEWDQSFCRMFYIYHPSINRESCARTPYLYEKKVPEYKLCAMYIVTAEDVWTYSPSTASDLNVYSLCPSCIKVLADVDPLYPGHFIKLGESTYANDIVDPVQTKSGSIRTAAYRDIKLPGGQELGGFIMHQGCTARGDPGGGKWAYDLPQMLQLKDRNKLMEEIRKWNITGQEIINQYLPLKLSPYDMGDGTFRAWEIANRHREGTMPQTPKDEELGSIFYHYRPHPIFQRYKYNIAGFERECGKGNGGGGGSSSSSSSSSQDKCKYNRMGEAYKLTAVTMPPWNEQCDAVRLNQTNHCLEKNKHTTTEDVNVEGYAEDVEGPCGYRTDNVFKLFVGNLRSHSPEAWYLLSKMQVTAEDLETMVADMAYNETLRSQFIVLKEGTSDNFIVSEGKKCSNLFFDDTMKIFIITLIDINLTRHTFFFLTLFFYIFFYIYFFLHLFRKYATSINL